MVSSQARRLIPPANTGFSASLHAEAGMRIGLYGGSFNPAHQGHLAISLEALKRLGLHRIWWLVSPGNPLKNGTDIAPLDERLASARDMARDRRIVVSDIERRLQTRYTSDTVATIIRRWPDTGFVWVAGADVLVEFHRWRAWQQLAWTIPLAFFDRPGFGLRAATSPFAVRFAPARRDESDAGLLASARPPAWSLIHIPLRTETATDLRERAVSGPKTSHTQ